MAPAIGFAKFIGLILAVAAGAQVALFALAGFAMKGTVDGAVQGAKLGAVSGLLLTLALACLDHVGRRHVVTKYGVSWDYRPTQVRFITAQESPSTILAILESKLKTLPWIDDQTVTRTNEAIEAFTHPTMSSFRERIRLDIKARPELGNQACITIRSAPRSIGTIVDYGKNLRNVEELNRSICDWVHCTTRSSQTTNS